MWEGRGPAVKVPAPSWSQLGEAEKCPCGEWGWGREKERRKWAAAPSLPPLPSPQGPLIQGLGGLKQSL